MSFNIEPTGNQGLTQREVEALLAEARALPTRKNPRVLAVDQLPLMRAKNGGYPVHLYHERLGPVVVTREEEEMAAATIGYQREYIRHNYPKVIHRRNMEDRFEPKFDPATGAELAEPWVESRTARDAQHETELRRMKPKKGQSDWFDNLAELRAKAPIEEAPEEDPAVTIARLTGELTARRERVSEAPRKRRGRPPKTQPEAEPELVKAG